MLELTVLACVCAVRDSSGCDFLRAANRPSSLALSEKTLPRVHDSSNLRCIKAAKRKKKDGETLQNF